MANIVFMSDWYGEFRVPGPSEPDGFTYGIGDGEKWTHDDISNDDFYEMRQGMSERQGSKTNSSIWAREFDPEDAMLIK